MEEFPEFEEFLVIGIANKDDLWINEALGEERLLLIGEECVGEDIGLTPSVSL